jgi:putative endonuclease
MAKYCYVYVLRSLHDKHFYVGLTRNLSARLQAHNKGLVNSTKERIPLELVYWEGYRDESDAARREKVPENCLGKTLHKNSNSALSHGVNDRIAGRSSI